MDAMSINTRMKETPDAEWQEFTQSVSRDGDDLVYHAEGKAGEVRVNATEYVTMLRELTGL